MKDRQKLMQELANSVAKAFQNYLSESKDSAEVLAWGFQASEKEDVNTSDEAFNCFVDVLQDGIRVIEIVKGTLEKKVLKMREEQSGDRSWKFHKN